MVEIKTTFLVLVSILGVINGDYLSFDEFTFYSPGLEGTISHRSDSGEIILSNVDVYMYLEPYEIIEKFKGYVKLVDGVSNFAMKIYCDGTYNLKAVSDDSLKGVSQEFTREINSGCYPIDLSVDLGENEEVTFDKDFRIYGTFIYSDYSDYYFKEIYGDKISGETSSYLDYQSFDSTLKITGGCQRTIMMIIDDYYSIIAIDKYMGDCLNFEFVDKKPEKVNESFSVKATVDRELETSEYELEIIVFIDTPARRIEDTSSYLSGTLVQTTVNGEALFSGLKFLASGDYGFYVNNANLFLQDTEYLTILKESSVNLIEITALNDTFKLGKKLIVTIYLYEDKVLFKESVEVNIAITGLAFEGDTTIKTDTGIADFSLSFTTIGKAVITATTTKDDPDVVVESFTIYSIDPLCLAFDSERDCIECIYLAEFVQGTCECLNHYYYENFDCILDDGVSLIMVSSSGKHLKLGETITVTVFLLNENFLYEEEAEVTLFSSDLVITGESSVTSSTGIFEFEIQFTNLGETILTAQSSKDYNDCEVISFTVFSIDPLCMVFDNDENCLECIYLAEFVDGLCECIENTHYDDPNCVYDDGVDFLSVVASTDILKLGKTLIITISLSLNSIEYTEEAEVTLIVNGLDFVGENKQITSNGMVEFEITFLSLGVAQITAESSKDFSNAIAQSITVYSIDPQCANLDSDHNCNECIYLAEFVDGLCECIENTYYDEPYCVYEDGINLILVTASTERLKLGKTLTVSVFLTLNSVLYTEETEVTLDSFGLQFEGENKVITTTGMAEFYISFTSLGSAKLEAKSTNDYSNVKIESFNVFSVDPLCLVFDENSNCIQCIYLADFVDGMCSCINNSYYEEPRCILDDGIDLIMLSGSKEVIEYGQTLTVFVLLFENYLMYTDELEVTLYSSDLKFEGNNKVITSTGIAEFSIKFAGLGKTTLTARSSRDLNDVEITSFDVYSTDPLCSVLDSEEKCLKCINLSDFVEGFCTCIENSYYDESSCLCNDGYFDDLLSNCQKCSNQFSDKDIVSYYNSDYKEITVEFIENVMNSTQSCDKFVTLPSSYEDIYLQCSWINSKTFILIFSEQLPAVNIDITIDSSLVPLKKLCNFYQQETIITVEMIYDLPYPVLDIISPSICSIPCLQEDPIVKHAIVSTDFEYSWSASSSSQSLINYIEGQNLPVLTLSKDLLVSEDLYIYATVKSILYGTKSSKSILIKVTNQYLFTVEFDYGSQISVNSFSPLLIKAQVLSSCNVVGAFTYSWKYYSDSLLDLDYILQNSPRPDTIYLPPNTLSENKNYIIEVNVTSSQTGIYGIGQISIDVMINELKLKLNRWGGTVGSEIDLEIIATVENSENMDLSIDYEWSCKEGSVECIGNNGNALYSSTSGNILTITKDQLRNRAIYLFKVVASTVQNNAEQEVEFKIDNEAKGEIIIETSELVIDNSKNYKLVSKIKPPSKSTFSWDFDPDLNSNSKIDFKNSFIIITPFSLQVGLIYKVTLTMSPASASSIIAYTFISRSNPPTCDSFKSEKLSNKYYLEGISCSSSQSVLYYQFGYSTDKKYWVTNSSPLSSASVFIDDNAEKLLMEVCDDYECTLYENPAANSNQRRELAIIDDFLDSIANYDDIPSAVIYYVKKADSKDTYNTIVLTMGNYFYSEMISDANFNLYISCLYSVLENSTYVSPEIFTYLNNLTIYILSEYPESCSNSEAESIVDSFSEYISLLEYTDLHNFFSAIKNSWFQDKLPGESFLNIEGKLNIYSNRLFSSNLPSLDLSFSHSNISIPVDLEIDSNIVIDIFYAKYTLNDDFFDLSFYESGTYIDYTLVITESKEIQLISESKIQVEINGTYNLDMNYECQYYNNTNSWENSGCNIIKISETKITASLNHLSSFRINEFSKQCEIGRGPVIAMGVLILICCFLVGIFLKLDYNNEDSPKNDPFLFVYPYSNWFYPQPYFRRSILTLQILCNFLVLFCLIGVLEVYFNSPEEKSTDDYGDYFESSIYSGAAAWAITQSFIIPFFLYNCVIEKSKVGFIIQGIIWAICTSASIIGISYMTAVYCNEYTFYWIINILIFTPIQIVLDTLYALLIRYILCRNYLKDDVNERTSKSGKIDEKNIFTEPDRQNEDNRL
ncbi:hypothetical protein SteCoe_25477 [Stentor coeruleus]|uniref:EGF-like domain-containing protein n=1 Tax=Stentor coeruleus TaxID=5963 RepID=A0A1R2BF84_9CILI|nr:hypothetical protein SteCoe_25477 [Stentor coeruleus]